jgi:hypothetical protein
MEKDTMEILAFIGSAILFALFTLVVLFVLIKMSARLALIILFLIPVIPVLLMPGIAISFLSHRHMLLADGLVPINNFHILLMLWSTLVGLILYTEFLTWYLRKGRSISKGADKNKSANPFATIQESTSTAIGTVKNGLLKR